MVVLEVCIDSPAGLRAAVDGGADRLEVCSRLDAGGLTPEASLVSQAVATDTVCMAMLRPRAGDFVYCADEKARILEDLACLKVLGIRGVVVGALTSERAIDSVFVGQLVARARPLEITFHRAFDAARDTREALETLIGLGIERVLTSGGAKTAHAGRAALRALVDQAQDRITIVAGGGVRAHNAPEIVRASGVVELHSSTVFAIS